MYLKLNIVILVFSLIQLFGIKAVYSADNESKINKPATSQAKSELVNDDPSLFFEMSLDELLNQKITSVARKPQKLIEAPAAIYVITQEDIQRSAAASIPELLRMVPGVNVARIDSRKWAISVRGFNRPFSTKLLVLIDGRSVYSPLFSGVYWDIQDVMLEDLDRIEIIRGPGAALWGANAVNGVINIITKSAKDTQGSIVSAVAGNEDEAIISTRYGGRTGNVWYRIFAKYLNRDENVTISGDNAKDGSALFHTGFSLDWEASGDDTVTVQGDFYQGENEHSILYPILEMPYSLIRVNEEDVKGGNILLKWQHRINNGSEMILQTYYDRTERKSSVLTNEVRDTLDIDLLYSLQPWNSHTMTWGIGYRFTADEVDNSEIMLFVPDSENDNLFSAFIQDDIALLKDKIHLILGSKFEHNDYTGFEIQPNIRMIWTPRECHQVWAAVSRALRSPSRFTNDVELTLEVIPPDEIFPGSPLTKLVHFGNEDTKPEELIAYEMGYRVQPANNFSIDIAAFYFDYDSLNSTKRGEPFMEESPIMHQVLPLIRFSEGEGESYGAEILVNWWVLDLWRLSASYSFLEIDTDDERTNGESPENQFSVRSYLNLPYNLKFDLALYYVDNLPSHDISSYVRTDARLAWIPRKDIELSISVENMFDDKHPEFIEDSSPLIIEIERSVYGKITWQF